MRLSISAKIPAFLLLPAMLACTACSTAPTPSPAVAETAAAAASGDHSEENFQKYLAQCQQDYAASDARIAAAGVRDAEYTPVEGFPYLRTDRLMASYSNEVDGNIDKLGIWMLQLREYDSIAREIELTNLGITRTQRADELYSLRTCAVWMSDAAVSDPATLKRLLASVRVPDASVAEASAETREAIAERQARIRAEFAAPLTTRRSARLWQVAPAEGTAPAPENLNAARRDELGRVGLIISQWPALAAKFAPRFLIDGSNADDHPVAPAWTAQGIAADPAQPVVYYLASYARVGTHMLVQFNYLVWFGAAVPDSSEPPLEGLIWRVTLDEEGRKPIAYDTIKLRGGDHLWFPHSVLQVRNPSAVDAPLIPQKLAAGDDFDVVLAAGTHDVRRLAPASRTRVNRYTLRPYEDLLTLATPSGGARSLFGPDGLVPGSRAPSTASAVESGLGALRRWGDQRSSPLAAVYFDDPYLLQQQFVLKGIEPTAETALQDRPKVQAGTE